MTVSRKTRAARWGGALLVALAPLPWLGFGSAQAADAVVYATVTGHEAFSSDANQADYWGDDCEKIVDSGSLSSYVLMKDYALVVVKAASKNVDPYTNTLFADASAGETVWADTNGNYKYDVGGKGGDKAISHIIVCEGDDSSSSSAPASSSAPVTTKPPTTKPPTTTRPPTSPSVTETETTGTATPSSSSAVPSSSSAAPSSSSAVPSSSSAAPSTEISTSIPGSPPESSSPEVTEIETSAGALPKTGSDVPVAGALGISLLLIGVGILLLLGPGRLIPATYHRKH